VVQSPHLEGAEDGADWWREDLQRGMDVLVQEGMGRLQDCVVDCDEHGLLPVHREQLTLLKRTHLVFLDNLLCLD